MSRNLVARASASINAGREKVWEALVDPRIIKKYMFGTDVVSEWREGLPIVWKGVWQGKPYEDKGIILKFVPATTVSYSHYSPLSGMADLPENYHVVTVELSGEGNRTTVRLSQDNNENEEARAHSEKNWEMMLAGLKKVVEGD